jgi:streptogramin lyase
VGRHRFAAWLTVGFALLSCGGASAAELVTPVLYPFDMMYRGEVGELAAEPDGYLWVTQQSEFPWPNGEIVVFAPDGEPVGVFDLIEEGFGEEAEPLPSDIAAGYNGEIWFTDEQSSESEDYLGRIKGGNFERLPIDVQAKGPGRGPQAITRGPGGEMWFTDDHADSSGHAFIGSVSPGGEIHIHPIPVGDDANTPTESIPMGIAADAGGELWFTDRGTNRQGRNLVGRIDQTGKVTEYPLKKAKALPTAIALGADGNMWFVERGVQRIGRITPDGDVTEFGVPFVSSAINGITRGPGETMWFSGGDGELGWISPSGIEGTFVTNSSEEDSAFTESVAFGPEGSVWFTEPTPGEPEEITTSKLGKLVRLVSPVSIAPPIVSGNAVVGAILSASPGTWQPKPVTYVYQWEQCDAASEHCLPIEGATEASITIGGEAIGGRLRVALTASNPAGAGLARSAATEVVRAPDAPQPAPIAADLPSLVSVPLVPASPRALGTTVTFSFSPSKGRFKRVRALMLHDLVRGSRVEVRCSGHGCAYSRRVLNVVQSGCRSQCLVNARTIASGDVDIAPLFKRRRLRPGARVSVSILMPEWIGRLFLFSVKAGHPVVFEDRCLGPGSSTMTVGCVS